MDFDRLAMDALAPGLSVRIRLRSGHGVQCLCDTENHCHGILEWMEHNKEQAAKHGHVPEKAFTIDVVDKDMKIIRELWSGDV